MSQDETKQAALEAANRIMHMDYPQGVSEPELRQMFVEDAQLVAGVLIAEAAT